MNLEFFNKLYADPAFCKGVGKMVLNASKLESQLRIYLIAQGVDVPEKNVTLGRLTQILKEKGLLSRNGVMHFDALTSKRNYLAHKLYDLFAENIEETILPRTSLVDMDIELFAERASGLADDLGFFSSFLEKKISRLIGQANTKLSGPLL